MEQTPTHTLFIRVTPEQHEAVRLLAFTERRSIADVVREAVDRLLASPDRSEYEHLRRRYQRVTRSLKVRRFRERLWRAALTESQS
jgi:hypothetical protein